MGTLVDIPFSLVPAIDIQIDNSRANRGFVLERFRILLLGQMLAGGTAVANVPVRVVGESDAVGLFGRNSMLHHMVRALRANN
jgi:phage tail sheath gpL-like